MGESDNGSRRPSQDSETPPMPTFASKTFKRKKLAVPEPPKLELDLAAALPSSDDFRTSLLMPNLSARFSMLREQDDPTSKLGKANDDSVLFPKRASRLDLFNRQGLSDIAEVDSIRGSIRPPFATNRTESYGSGGYDTDEGSVMSRARPGEGNTMFGGRQKIYKIPVGGSGSVKNFGATEEGELPSGGNMGGKALYESDIATSAFQRLREQERQERETQGLDSHSQSREQDRSGSPPLAKYNLNRETSSSTNSGPSQPRTSTAATSVASQRSAYEAINGSAHNLSSTQPSSAGSDRPFQKPKRLYGQGLDQHMHEQQFSALNRLESLQRQRTVGAGPTPRELQHTRRQSRSASNLNDRYQRGGPLYASNGFRAASPAPSGTPPRMQDFDLGLNNDQNSHPRADSAQGRSPPLSPPLSSEQDLNQDPTFVASLEPNDLGKATASGAFSKPIKQYNEQQYLQRQLQLQEGRGTPSPQLFRPFSPAANSIDEKTTGRSRNNSFGSQFSRTGSFRQPWEHHIEDRVLPAVRERGNSPSIHESEDGSHGAMGGTFFAGNSGSDLGSQPDSESEPNSPAPPNPKYQNSSAPASQQLNHDNPNRQLYFPPDPNHLSEPAEEAASDSRSYRSEKTITQQRDDFAPETPSTECKEADSPTLGPVDGISNGLSGLVRAHLRNDSGQSSVYPEDEPLKKNRFSIEVRDSIFGHESALTHSRQQSRDETEADNAYWAKQNRTSDHSSVTAPPPLSFAARHILDQATALRNNQENYKARQMRGDDKAQRILGGEAPRSGNSGMNSDTWQEQLKSHHTRGMSNETQDEREALANELAERRRMVQDNLRTYVEAESRSASPGPRARPQDNSPAKTGHPFGILKKSSRDSLVGKQLGRPSKSQERPSKAMKMLGISLGNGSGPGPNGYQPPPDMFMGREQLSDRAMPPRQKYSPQQRRPQDVRQHLDHPPNFIPREAGSQRSQENGTHKHSPNSSKSGSNYSDLSDRRPESRKGSTLKSSPERGRVHGFATNGVNPVPESQKAFNPPRPTEQLMASMASHGLPPAERSRSAMSGRLRNNSKTPVPGYFEQKRTAPPNTPFMINPDKRPPYPYSAHSTPSLHQGRDPSLSTSSTSTTAMMPPQSAPSQTYGRPDKRSISKHDISEPTFIFCTSSVDTVNLPPEASLKNGMESPPTETNAPPIPVRDSRRKRTHTLLQALGRMEKPQPSPTKHQFAPSPIANPREEDKQEVQSGFSADDEPDPRTLKQGLRERSSEGGSMHNKTRQQMYESPSPAVPNFPGREVGDMMMPEPHVPYQVQKDVPASAVMF